MTDALTEYADWIGYAGAACVVVAFCMRQMLPLRMMAIAGNMVFIAYALTVGAMPVLIMNLLLLPLNLMRLVQTLRAHTAGASVVCEQRASMVPTRSVIRMQRVRQCFAPLV